MFGTLTDAMAPFIRMVEVGKDVSQSRVWVCWIGWGEMLGLAGANVTEQAPGASCFQTSNTRPAEKQIEIGKTKCAVTNVMFDVNMRVGEQDMAAGRFSNSYSDSKRATQKQNCLQVNIKLRTTFLPEDFLL